MQRVIAEANGLSVAADLVEESLGATGESLAPIRKPHFCRLLLY
jgi:hypothetical protein